MSARTYVIRRLALVVLVLFGVATLTFMIVRILPSEPAAVYLGPRPTPEPVSYTHLTLPTIYPV